MKITSQFLAVIHVTSGAFPTEMGSVLKRKKENPLMFSNHLQQLKTEDHYKHEAWQHTTNPFPL